MRPALTHTLWNNSLLFGLRLPDRGSLAQGTFKKKILKNKNRGKTSKQVFSELFEELQDRIRLVAS